MRSPILSRVLPVLIACGIPSAIVGCSSGDDDTSNNNAGNGTGGSSNTGTGGASAGKSSGGAPGTGGTGGSVANGGTGGGMTTGGSAGQSMAGGAGKGTAGGGTGGSSTGGASTGGSSTGGSSTGGSSTGGSSMGGASTGGASSGGMGTGGGAAGGAGAPMGGAAGSTTGGTFTLLSTDHMDGAKFDGKFTCDGGSLGAGINPELHWTGTPAGAMSFAITFIDVSIGADNSMGQHWGIYNIPASVMEVAQGAFGQTLMGDLSTAKQVTPLNKGFLAPCATSVKNGMDDNYEFTIYAINTVNFSGGSSVKSLLQALGVLDSSGKIVNPPMLNAAVLGTAVLKGHAGVKGQ